LRRVFIAPSRRRRSRVALRLGYPGNEAASIARALDAEVPEGDVTSVAWRAHHSLQVIGDSVCTKDRPRCVECAVESACDFHGVGLDPSKRLGGLDGSEG
jgi:endonuclease III